MSEKIDKFCDDLKLRLNGIETHLLQVQDRLSGASRDAEETIKTKLTEAKAKLAAKKEEIVAAKDTLAQRLEAKKVEVEADMAQWKEKKEQEKLLAHADKAEEYALAAILMAAAVTEEAEVAVLEAIEARMVAESITVDPVQEPDSTP